MTIQTKFKYWEIFYNPDIPMSTRVKWAAASPIVIPLLGLSAMSGCSSLPDDPLPVKAFDKPLPFPEKPDATADAEADTVQQDTYSCEPDPCAPDHLDLTRRKGGDAMCIQFKNRVVAGPAEHTGISIVDINNDGLSDIYVLTHNSPNRLFISNGGENFVESAKKYALNLDVGVAYKAVWQGFEGAAMPQLLMLTNTGATLYKNDGSAFYMSAQLTADATHAAVWFKEGFLLGTENGLRVFVPNADSSYNEASKDWGLVDNGDAHEFALVDIESDKDTDIYVANETGNNRLFRNNGDGTFEAADGAFAINKVGQSPSRDAKWIEFGPGEPAKLYVSNFGAASWLFEWQADKTFVDVAKKYGLQDGGKTIRAAWGNFLDEKTPAVFIARSYEDDSEKDKQLNLLYIPVYAPDGTPTSFRDIAYPNNLSGPEKMVGAEWADVNGDGKLDLVTAAYNGSVTAYINDSKWVKVCQ